MSEPWAVVDFEEQDPFDFLVEHDANNEPVASEENSEGGA